MSTPIRVLIVEDSEGDARLMTLELKKGGYVPTHERVDTAAAMGAALERASWDVVLSDQNMPQFNASEALRILTDHGLAAPFIIVSGSVEADVVVEAMKAGACDYVRKEDLGLLVPAVDRALRVAREREEKRRAFDALQRSEEALKEQLALIQRQQEAIRALSTPIIEVWDGVLTVPVLGALDAHRAQEMMDTVLHAVSQRGCRHVIIDVTGVATMDAMTAENLIKLVSAVELLGAQGIVVGIQPEVARAIVAIGVDLAHVVTLGSLRDALVLCMHKA